MKRFLTLACFVALIVVSLAAVNNASAGQWICYGNVLHDGSAYQGAIVSIYYTNHCLAQTKTDTTDAAGYFCVPSSLGAGNYLAYVRGASHLEIVSFYFNGNTLDPTPLGTITLSGFVSEEACKD